MWKGNPSCKLWGFCFHTAFKAEDSQGKSMHPTCSSQKRTTKEKDEQPSSSQQSLEDSQQSSKQGSIKDFFTKSAVNQSSIRDKESKRSDALTLQDQILQTETLWALKTAREILFELQMVYQNCSRECLETLLLPIVWQWAEWKCPTWLVTVLGHTSFRRPLMTFWSPLIHTTQSTLMRPQLLRSRNRWMYWWGTSKRLVVKSKWEIPESLDIWTCQGWNCGHSTVQDSSGSWTSFEAPSLHFMWWTKCE